jgi:cytochrome P450
METAMNEVIRPKIAGFSLFDPAFMADPYETVTRLHAQAPVFYDDAIGAWVVTKYEDISQVLTAPDVFSARAVGRIPPPAGILPRVPDFAVDEIIFALDPPEHTLARLTMQLGFSRKIVDSLAESIHVVADDVIDRIIDRGECNLINDFCYAFSLGVIMRMLDLPESHAEHYHRWSDALFALLIPKSLDEDGAYQTHLSEAQIHERWNDLAEANAFLREIAEERAKNPKDDMISAMLQARDNNGKAVDPGAAVRHALSLIAAGHDTTANLIANLVLLLSKNPDQLAAMKEDHTLIANTVEEGLRRRGPVATLFRITTSDVEIRGQSIPKNSIICLLVPGGNLDPAVFPEPQKFDIKRPNANRHFGFGRGRHACVGQPLARIEAPVALRKLYTRMPDLHVAADIPVEYGPSFGGAVIKQIVTRWTPPGRS